MIQITWSPNDVVLLDGTTSETTALSRPVFRNHYNVTFESQWSYNRFTGVGAWGSTTRALYFDRNILSLRSRVSTSQTNPFAGASQVWNYSPAPPVFVSDSSEYPYANLTGRWVYAWIKASDGLGFGNAAAGSCTNTPRQPVVNGWVLVSSLLSSEDPTRPYISGGKILSITPVCGNFNRTEIYAYRVTTNLSLISERETTTPPTVVYIPDDCPCCDALGQLIRNYQLYGMNWG